MSIAGNNRGFTLLELIIVLFISGLSAAIVLFSIGRLRDQTLFSQDVRRVYQTARHGREVALLDRKVIILRVDEESKSYWLDDNGNMLSKKQGVQRESVITGKDIVFYPKGNSTGGSITVRNAKGKEFTITVSPVLGVPSVKRL
ncbi:MAG: prepilin-type N-terminal cleavage/methylation domain-containing protein [Nitrospirae bacterium]|nr:prepilin-type N-terminal cleavage/methylation domain-containing protein [Nitrospirota bacterium]